MRRVTFSVAPQGSSTRPAPGVSKPRPAAAAAPASATPPAMNQSQGSTLCFSWAQPAPANTSPSPVASITVRARTAKRPALPWKATPATRPSSAIGSQAREWSSSRTPASQASSWSANFISSGS